MSPHEITMSTDELDPGTVPAYDPANPIFGPTDVGLSMGLEDTNQGPILFLGFRTSNCTFTVPLESVAEVEDLIRRLEMAKKAMSAKAVRAQFQIPQGLFVPDHIAGQAGPTMPLRRPE